MSLCIPDRATNDHSRYGHDETWSGNGETNSGDETDDQQDKGYGVAGTEHGSVAAELPNLSNPFGIEPARAKILFFAVLSVPQAFSV